MSVSTDGTMTAYQYAQQYLGDGRRFHELGGFLATDPNQIIPAGYTLTMPNESMGPPAVQMVPIPPHTQYYDNPLPDGTGHDGINENLWSDIMALADQYAQMTGYRIVPNHGDIVNMARSGIRTMYDMGQYMQRWGEWQHSADKMQAMPWAAYGLTQEQFESATRSYSDMVQQMTGRAPSQADIANALMSTKGKTDPTHWRDMFMQDANNRKQFGWIKHGMNYQQFQDFRDTQQRKFGHTLGDAEGAQWLDEQSLQQQAPVEGQKEVAAQPKTQKKEESQQMAAIR